MIKELIYCQSCGMPLNEQTFSRFNRKYCRCCQDQISGKLASREEVREGSIKAAMTFLEIGREDAEKVADEMLPKLPRWRE